MKSFYLLFILMLLVMRFVSAETKNTGTDPDVKEACAKVKNKQFSANSKNIEDLAYFNELADPKKQNYNLDLAIKWICEGPTSASANNMREVILEISKQKKSKIKTAIDICSYITSSRDGNYCAYLAAKNAFSSLEKEIQGVKKTLGPDLLNDYNELTKIIDDFATGEAEYIYLSYGIGLGANGGMTNAHRHIKETYTKILLTNIRKKPEIINFEQGEYTVSDRALNQKFKKMKEISDGDFEGQNEDERAKKLEVEKTLKNALVSSQKKWIQLKEKSAKFFAKKYSNVDYIVYIQYVMTQQRLKDLEMNH